MWLRRHWETSFTFDASAPSGDPAKAPSGEQAVQQSGPGQPRERGERPVRVSAFRTAAAGAIITVSAAMAKVGGGLLVHELNRAEGTCVVWRWVSRQNDKRATAAVMRYGYGRGGFFEGCEPRCGKGRMFTIDCWLWLTIDGGTVRKRSEPYPVSGCNKPEACERSKPSRWCETTRAERVGRLAAIDRTEAAMSSGSGRERGGIGRGAHTRTISREADKLKIIFGWSILVRDDGWRSRGDTKFMRDAFSYS